jgi:hypothetical protein
VAVPLPRVLLSPAEASHQRLWPLTVTRVRTLAELVRDGNWELTPPILVNPYGTSHLLDARPPTVTLPSLTDEPTPEPTTSWSEPASSTGATPTRPASSTSTPSPTGTTTSTPAGLPNRLEGQIVGVDGVCLDLSNGRIDLNFVKTWECNGTNAQWWTADPDGTISITISPPPEPGLPESGCLRPLNGSAVPGTGLELVPCDPTEPAQQWRFENGRIRNVGTNRCLSVPDGPEYYGHKVIMAACADVPKQIWSYPH